MKSIVTLLLVLLPFAAALLNSSSKKGYGPSKVSCKTGKRYNIDFSFAVSVPTIADVADLTTTINYGGYRFAIPAMQWPAFLSPFSATSTGTRRLCRKL